MKKRILLISCLFVIGGLGLNAQSCDDFNIANTSTIPGWTEQIGDWMVDNNTLQSPATTVWNYLTVDGSSQADGCLSGRAIYGSGVGLRFMALVGRYSSGTSNILVKLQDNNNSGYWDAYYIYCNDIIVVNNDGYNFGTDANIKMEYAGANVTLMVDTDRNGSWDYTFTTTVTNTSSGLCGVGAYEQCYLDDFCYGSVCLLNGCSDFTAASGTTVPGWTEQAGDFSIDNNMLLTPAGGWNYITKDGSTRVDGCITAQVFYLGTTGTRFVGLVGRYSAPGVDIMVKIQDNNGSGYFDSYFVMDDGTYAAQVASGLNFGTNPKIRMEFYGPTVYFKVDSNLDGIWDYSDTVTVSNVSAGLCGVGSYQACKVDDWCVEDNCCDLPGTADTITGSVIVCADMIGVPYSITALPTATAYVWNYSGSGATINGNGNSVTLDFPSGATSGILSVMGQNSCGDGALANLSIVVDPCLGISRDDASRPEELHLYPNPNNGSFSLLLETGSNTSFNVMIHDVMGNLIYQKDYDLTSGLNKIELDLGDKPAGVYYMSAYSASERYSRKILIVR